MVVAIIVVSGLLDFVEKYNYNSQKINRIYRQNDVDTVTRDNEKKLGSIVWKFITKEAKKPPSTISYWRWTIKLY